MSFSPRHQLRRSSSANRPSNNEEKPLEAIVMQHLVGLETIYFVQVGANDGFTYDPFGPIIRDDKRWQGIFVEPVGYILERLRQNYDNQTRFIFENVAIGTQDIQTFYYVSETAKEHIQDLPAWYDQLGSFNRDHIGKLLDGALVPFIVETQVRCTDLMSLLAKHGFSRLDVLLIDVEGYDFMVLSQLDFRKYRPKIIIYEHINLALPEEVQARNLLQQHGYSFKKYHKDIVAIRRSSLEWFIASVKHILRKISRKINNHTFSILREFSSRSHRGVI